MKKTLAGVACVVLIALQCACAGPLPERSDCIVKLVFDWPENIAFEKREGMIKRIARTITFSAAKGGPAVRPQISAPLAHRSLMYLQLSHDCDARLSRSRALVDYVNKVVPSAPPIRVSTDRVQPGPDTIDVWGPDWADKPAYAQ